MSSNESEQVLALLKELSLLKELGIRYDPGGIADVHYVDEAGREIPPDKALAAVGERPATAVPTRQ